MKEMFDWKNNLNVTVIKICTKEEERREGKRDVTSFQKLLFEPPKKEVVSCLKREPRDQSSSLLSLSNLRSGSQNM